MEEILYFKSYTEIFIVLCITCLFFLIKYKKNLEANNIIDYFIYLTNKTTLLYLFVMFLFMSVFSIIDFSNEKIIEFFKKMLNPLLFFSLLNYSVYLGLNLIPKCQDFIKKNDLFTLGFFSKGGNKR